MYKILIVMGSDSDLPVLEEAAKVLDDFSMQYKIAIASAHRTPEKVTKLIRDAEKNGVEVIIAGAGMAAHLAGVVASHTLRPVIGVPLSSSPLSGFDSLLSTVQMPPGIPVGTMAIGKAGAKNSAFYALQILALKDKKISERLEQYRRDMKKEIEEKDRSLNNR